MTGSENRTNKNNNKTVITVLVIVLIIALIALIGFVVTGKLNFGAEGDENIETTGDERLDTNADPNDTDSESLVAEDKLTEELALNAVKNYVYEKEPGLKEMENSEDYTIYFTVETNEEDKIVVLYRAYTGAQIRYYIDRETGDTYITELVPGIIDEETESGETFNVKDYL
jgi:hypothetical protein